MIASVCACLYVCVCQLLALLTHTYIQWSAGGMEPANKSRALFCSRLLSSPNVVVTHCLVNVSPRTAVVVCLLFVCCLSVVVCFCFCCCLLYCSKQQCSYCNNACRFWQKMMILIIGELRIIVSEMYTPRSVHYHGRGVLDDRIGPLKYYYSRTYIENIGKVTKRPSSNFPSPTSDH